MKRKRKIFALLLSLCMVLTMMPAAAFAQTNGKSNTSGLTVEWNDEDITSGTIEIDEGGGNGVSLPIKYNGDALGEGVWVMGESLNETVCNAGVSPDNKYFELYLSGNAVEGDECKVTLLYGNKEKPETLTLTVKVIAGIRLKIGDKIIKAGETISDMASASAQVFLGNTRLTEYNWGVQGTTVCAINNETGDGTLRITTIGNGYSNFSVSCTDASQKEHEATFTWHGSGIDNDDANARNMTLTLNNKTKQAGEKFTLRAGTFTGKALFNGQELKDTEYEVKINRGNGCTVQQKNDGTFTLTVDTAKDGYYELVIKKKTGENENKIEATFWIQAQNPTAYVLQFYGMEQLADGNWRNTGLATLGVFKKAKDVMYAKYIVTDEEMRRIDDDHFVNVTPGNIKVEVWSEDKDAYVDVGDSNPFSFEMVSGQEDLMKISYDRSKDKNGPEYKLVYTDCENDEYLCINDSGIKVEKTLLLWTRSITELMSRDRLDREDDSWNYDARKPSREGLEDNENCDIKDVSVSMPAGLFGEGENQITVAENKSTLTVETDLGNVTFDDKVMSEIDDADKDVILGIRRVEEEDEDYKKIKGVLGGSSTIIDLSLEHEGGKISDFGRGTASVELTYEQGDKDKTPQVYYVDDTGAKTAVKTQYNAASAKLTFETNHFSMYAVEEIKSTPVPSSGGYVAPITDTVTNKTGDKTGSTAATTTTTVKNTTTTAADGTKTVAAKVEEATANKIVEKAVENKSTEVVVNAATKAVVTETEAGTKTEVAIPAVAVSQVAEKTEAAVTIKSDAAEIKLDKEAVKAVAEAAGTTGEVKLEVATVAQNEDKVELDLKLVTSKGNVSDFKGGSVSVTVKLNAKLAKKEVKCVYIDDNSVYHGVKGQKNADGTFTFKTGHFSSYVVMAAKDADKVIAEQTAKVEKLVSDLTLKARSAKTAKGYIKVTLNVNADAIKAIEDLGYTVKYKFYRSTKKSASYKAKIEKAGKTYTNTAGKKGTKYYYKARVMAYDTDEALVAKSALMQCKYASRIK